MHSKGFLIWQLIRLPDQTRLVELLKSADIKWVSLKIADHDQPYNQIGGNDKILRGTIETLQDAGIAVGGWYCIHPPKARPSILT